MTDNLIEQKLKHRGVVLTLAMDSRRPARTTSPSSGDREYRAVFGRGVLWTDSAVISLDHGLPDGMRSQAVRHQSGQWFLLFDRASDDSYRIITDPLGYHRLYYSSFRRGDDQIVVIGDNQTSVVGELQRLGRPVDIDWPIAASHLLSTHTMMQSSFSHRTMYAGVRSLPAGAELVVDHAGAKEEHKHLFSAASDAGYDDLLEAGIARAQAQIRLLADSQVPDKRHALSGGRDSRMAMAMTVSAGVHREFTMMTADPRRSRKPSSRKVLEHDLTIASELRRHLGMQWSRESGITGVRHDAHTSLDIFQSHVAGARFAWAGSGATTWPDALRVEVHGGSGELLRRAYQNMRDHPSFGALDDRPETVAADARALFPTLVTHHGYLPQDMAEEAAEAFADSLDRDADLPMSEQLNMHYAAFRNRDHFGQINQQFARNSLKLYPLAQPEFLQASRLIDPDDRNRGRVAYDIIRMTYPQLNDFAFDDGHWPEPFPLTAQVRRHGTAPYVSADHRDFFEGEDLDTALRAATPLLSDPKHPIAPFDGTSAAASLAASSASELSDLADTPLENLHALIPTLIAQGRLVAGNTAAKLESMTAVFTGRHTPYDSVLFTSGLPANGSVLSAVGSWHSAPAPPVRVARDELLVFHVDLEPHTDEAVVTIRCNSAAANSVEWAVYLYQEQTKIGQKWYDDRRSARFSLADVPAGTRIRALVFTREKGPSSRVHRKFSAWRTI